MFGSSPTLPVSDPDRLWVDEGFRRLQKLLGHRRLLDTEVVLPTPEYFPDPYDATPATAEMLFHRVCNYMRVDCRKVELEVFPDETAELREILPYWRGDAENCAAGFFLQQNEEKPEQGEAACMVVAIRSTQLKDPLSLVATVAHELGHVILLGGRLIDHNTADHERLTDLLTVFLGLGIFTANCAGRFTQYQDDRYQGWSMQRLGYLPEDVFGYALAKFASERGDLDAKWAKHLSTNVRAYFKQSVGWLKKRGAEVNGTSLGSAGKLG